MAARERSRGLRMAVTCHFLAASATLTVGSEFRRWMVPRRLGYLWRPSNSSVLNRLHLAYAITRRAISWACDFDSLRMAAIAGI